MRFRRDGISAAAGSARRADPARPNFSLGESRANCETSGFRGGRRGQGRTSEFWFSLYQGEEAYLIFMRLTVSATSPKQRISLTQIRKQKMRFFVWGMLLTQSVS